MRLFTGKGDEGMTDLLGDRVAKDDPRIELIGALDETTSALGFARANAASGRAREWTVEIQRDLYKIMAELAFTDDMRPASYALGADRVTRLEELTDALSAEIELPPQFVLPGESVAGGAFDLARTIARRAERGAVALAHANGAVSPAILAYLNRLSSLAFMLARLEDREAGAAPVVAKIGRARAAAD